MSITVERNDEKRAVVVTFAPGWSWSDLAGSGQVLSDQLGIFESTVPILVDVRRFGPVPGQAFSKLSSVATKSPLFSHPNVGTIYIIGGKGMVDAIRRVFESVYASRAAKMHYVETFEDAYQRIAADA